VSDCDVAVIHENNIKIMNYLPFPDTRDHPGLQWGLSNKNDKRGHFNNEDDVDYLFSIGAGSAAPLGVVLKTHIQSILN
jgi:hypothetical protein